MELFIQIRDGQPFEHPIFGDNFREAFPEINPNNLPPEFARFIRPEPPILGTFDVNEGVTYEWRDGYVTDIHHIRPMTDDERAVKQAQIEDAKAKWEKFRIENPKLFPVQNPTASGSESNVIS